jgi:hypothetical protein
MQADLAMLPDLPQPDAEPNATEPPAAQITSISIQPEVLVNMKHEPWGVAIAGSSDSEEDYELEMLPITETEVNENSAVVYDDNCSGNETECLAKSGPSNGLGNLIRDALAPIGPSFVPIVPLSKFPYKYIPKNRKEDVADAFFNAGQFWNRSWDL